jgi:hypothetical protein
MAAIDQFLSDFVGQTLYSVKYEGQARKLQGNLDFTKEATETTEEGRRGMEDFSPNGSPMSLCAPCALW